MKPTLNDRVHRRAVLQCRRRRAAEALLSWKMRPSWAEVYAEDPSRRILAIGERTEFVNIILRLCNTSEVG